MANKEKFKTGVLLVNLGTPNSTATGDVREYLREFLMDKRVIDIPFLKRWMLVNLIIAPFRAPKSAEVYKKLWEHRGSPLLFHSEDVKQKLQRLLGNEYVVELAMRYQHPSIAAGLENLKKKALSKIIVLPLFPQYASATTGSVHDKVMEVVSRWQVIPEMNFIGPFFSHEKFVKAFAENGRKYMQRYQYEHVLFSFHGIPERQVRKASFNNYCQLNEKCCAKYHASNQHCYRAQCFETSRLLARELDIPEEKYTVCFQSRLGKNPWVRPYTDEVILELAKKGVKSVLAFSPAFVADCLETTVEVGEEFRDLFLENGGEQWQLVESLNSGDLWVECVKDLVSEKQQA